MRRSTSRIGKLPVEVLEEVNEKLYEGWEYREIRKWLFEEVAVEDVPALGLVKGERFGLVWLRSGKSMEHAWHHCELALGNWFRTWHGVWVREKLRRGDSMRMVRRAAVLTHVAGGRVARSEEAEPTPAPPGRGPDGRSSCNTDTARRAVATPEVEVISVSGGDVIMRSVLIDAISSIGDSPASLRDAAGGGRCDRREVAALANAWARLNQGRMEEEKLKLKTEDSRKAAFDEIGRDVQHNPEALELFYKLREVMEKEKEAKGK